MTGDYGNWGSDWPPEVYYRMIRQRGQGGGGSALPMTDPYFANVSLLMHCEGEDEATTFIDHSSYAHSLVTSGAAQIDTGQFKFGAASALFPVPGGAISCPNVGGELNFGVGDFTLETYVRFDVTTQQALFASDTNGEFFFQCFLGGGTTIGIGRNGTAIDSDAIITGLIDPSIWYHIAVTRESGIVRFFRDGGLLTINSGETNNQNYTITSNLVMGTEPSGLDLEGRLDEVRVTKGVARYIAPFTPRPAAFPDQ